MTYPGASYWIRTNGLSLLVSCSTCWAILAFVWHPCQDFNLFSFPLYPLTSMEWRTRFLGSWLRYLLPHTDWRRGWDSNPRTALSVYSLSRGAPFSHLGTSPNNYEKMVARKTSLLSLEVKEATMKILLSLYTLKYIEKGRHSLQPCSLRYRSNWHKILAWIPHLEFLLVETIGIEPILGGPCFPLSSQRPIPIWCLEVESNHHPPVFQTGAADRK